MYSAHAYKYAGSLCHTTHFCSTRYLLQQGRLKQRGMRSLPNTSPAFVLPHMTQDGLELPTLELPWFRVCCAINYATTEKHYLCLLMLHCCSNLKIIFMVISALCPTPLTPASRISRNQSPIGDVCAKTISVHTRFPSWVYFGVLL